MEAYRNQSKIDSQKLVRYIFGGAQHYEKYQQILKEAYAVGYEANLNLPEMSRLDAYNLVADQGERLKKVKSLNFLEEVPDYFLYMTNVHVRGGVGLLMSLHLVQVLGTEEQSKLWAPKIASREWVACYAQTELAHGSDVQSLKTFATFDVKTQEWVIHTPDVEAIKWWPGDLGLSGTHGIIMLRIISNGIDHGVYPLFVQLRDLKTHKALPGIEIGDIGPKLGYATKDNGFVRFTNFRVPKDALLGRFYKIDAKGDFKTVGNPKIIYASMMESRTALIKMHCATLFRGLQIVCRYSSVRKQFKDEEGKEITILDYQLQKYKLMKYVSRGYAMVFARLQLDIFLKKNMEAVKKENFDYLQESHVYLCGYKAYFTSTGVSSYVEMIQAAGGHGFSYFSGLTTSLTEMFADTILEGENSLLILQVARHLLKSLKMVQSGESDKIKGATKYLKDADALASYQPPQGKDELCTHNSLLKAMAKVSCYFVQDAAMAMLGHIGEGVGAKKAWDTKMGVRLLTIGKLHTVYTIAYESINRVRSLDDQLIRDVLLEVLLYFCIECIEEYGVYFLEAGAINPEQFKTLRDKREELIETLSPHLMKLCEGYQLDDKQLWSAIGHSNGKPYDNLYEWAKKYGSLNKVAADGHPATLKYRL